MTGSRCLAKATLRPFQLYGVREHASRSTTSEVGTACDCDIGWDKTPIRLLFLTHRGPHAAETGCPASIMLCAPRQRLLLSPTDILAFWSSLARVRIKSSPYSARSHSARRIRSNTDRRGKQIVAPDRRVCGQQFGSMQSNFDDEVQSIPLCRKRRHHAELGVGMAHLKTFRPCGRMARMLVCPRYISEVSAITTLADSDVSSRVMLCPWCLSCPIRPLSALHRLTIRMAAVRFVAVSSLESSRSHVLVSPHVHSHWGRCLIGQDS